MPVLEVMILAALQGFAEVLPISRSGHVVAAWIWRDAPADAAGLSVMVNLGAAIALAVAARSRLAGALGEGVRAIARPALFAASPGARDATALAAGALVSSLASWLVVPRVELWKNAPLPTGLGLIVTGLMLASTLLTRRPRGAAPAEPGTLMTGALVGLAHGIAVFPGASPVGAALTMLLWLGVRPGRAVDLAFLLTLLASLAAVARGLAGDRTFGLDAGSAIAALLVAIVAGLLGAAALRALMARRRLGALALWLVPLGLAMVAYARAL